MSDAMLMIAVIIGLSVATLMAMNIRLNGVKRAALLPISSGGCGVARFEGLFKDTRDETVKARFTVALEDGRVLRAFVYIDESIYTKHSITRDELFAAQAGQLFLYAEYTHAALLTAYFFLEKLDVTTRSAYVHSTAMRNLLQIPLGGDHVPRGGMRLQSAVNFPEIPSIWEQRKNQIILHYKTVSRHYYSSSD